jgi:hypothetical protein
MFHPDLPGLTFIGHYRGPGFPIMELQARWIARILAGELPLPNRAAMLDGIAQEQAIRSQLPRPQFPHGDLVGLADGLAKELGAFPTLSESDPLHTKVFEGPMVPAQYRLTGPDARPDLARALIGETPAPILEIRRKRHLSSSPGAGCSRCYGVVGISIGASNRAEISPESPHSLSAPPTVSCITKAVR